MIKEQFAADLFKDDEVLEFFMVKSIALKQGSNGKDYLDLTLGDRSGEINGKKWDVSPEEKNSLDLIKEGDIVKIKGLVTEWNNIRQLRVARIRKAAEGEIEDMGAFVKAAPESAESMYDFIMARALSIKDEGLQRMAVAFLKEEKSRLMYYPAAMRNHHAEMAGLLYHIKRMLDMGEKACDVYTYLNRDWVICGVILHDMEKLTEIESNEYGVSPGYSFEGKMLGHIVLGVKKIDKLAEKCGLSKEKTVMMEHMILSHHYEPEFGSPLRPMFAEAELLHYLDMVDAKMFDFEDNLSQVGPGNFTERVRTLDARMLYKPSFSEDK